MGGRGGQQPHMNTARDPRRETERSKSAGHVITGRRAGQGHRARAAATADGETGRRGDGGTGGRRHSLEHCLDPHKDGPSSQVLVRVDREQALYSQGGRANSSDTPHDGQGAQYGAGRSALVNLAAHHELAASEDGGGGCSTTPESGLSRLTNWLDLAVILVEIALDYVDLELR